MKLFSVYPIWLDLRVNLTSGLLQPDHPRNEDPQKVIRSVRKTYIL